MTQTLRVKEPSHMPNKQYTVGIVGLGYGRAHIAGFQAAGCKVVALCQRDTAAAAELAARYGVLQVFADWRAMLATARPDIVVIATPPALHYAIMTEAFAAGSHVVCEKPLALTVDEAHRMIAAAQAARRVAIVGFNWRFSPAMQRMKHLVDTGFLGRVFHVNCRWFNAAWVERGAAPSWRMDRAVAGYGALGDLGVHLIDLVRWLFGDIVRVLASSGAAYPSRTVPGGARAADAEDFSHVVAELRSGATLALTVSRVARGRNEHSLEAYGENGALELRQYRTGAGWQIGELRIAQGTDLLSPVDLPAPTDDAGESGDRLDIIGRATIAPMVRAFVAAIETPGSVPVPSLHDGLQAQAVLEAIAASVANQTWIDIAPISI